MSEKQISKKELIKLGRYPGIDCHCVFFDCFFSYRRDI